MIAAGASADTELYEANQATLVRIVSSAVTASRQTVEDACAFAWLQFLLHRPQHNRISWLVRVALREAWRLTAEEWRVVPDEHATQALVSHELAGDELIVWVDCSIRLNTLKESERRLLLLAAAGYSYAEIGERLGHTRRAVERRLKRARMHLAAATDRSSRRSSPHGLPCAA